MAKKIYTELTVFGTGTNYVPNLSASTINVVNLSGSSVSATTIYSGSTDLSSLFISSELSPTSGNLWSASTGVNSIIANNGTGNLASETYSFAGGRENKNNATHSFIGNGYGNTIGNYGYYGYAFIGGGKNNTILFPVDSFIGGGYKNTMSGEAGDSIIGGGSLNEIIGSSLGGCVIVGGLSNRIIGQSGGGAKTYRAFIGGGEDNTTYSKFSVIGGGKDNISKATGGSIFHGYTVIAGGKENFLGTSAHRGFIGGGFKNSGTTSYSTVINGNRNQSTGTRSFIGNGSGNTNSSTGSFIGNGIGNIASGQYSFIANGNRNTASGQYSFIANGNRNTASGQYSAIVGGTGHTVSGINSVIVGGGSIVGVENDTVYVPNLRSIGSVSAETFYSGSTDVSSLFGQGTVKKYTLTTGFTANVPLTITHNLNTIFITLNTWDATANELIIGSADTRTTNTVNLAFSSTLSSVDVVITG